MTTAVTTSCRKAAIELVERKLPITLCKAKSPKDAGWQNKRYSVEQVESAFAANPDLNVGIILGPQSGIIDVECDSEQAEQDLLELFGGDVPKTWSYHSTRGKHFMFRWDERFDTLAKAVVKVNAIEVRLGAGGKAAHSLVPPSTTNGFTREWIVSPAECDLASLPEPILQKLLEPAETKQSKPQTSDFKEYPLAEEFKELLDKGRPGDEFNKRATWEEILEPKGWVKEKESKGVVHWRRPGKEQGSSATTGFCETDRGTELFHCFTANAAPLEGDTSYSRFALYTVLYHDGDFKEAAKELQRKGYGPALSEEENSRPGKATQLVELALSSGVELFHDLDGDAFASFPVADHVETSAVNSEAFSGWLDRLFFEKKGKVAGSSTLKDAVGLLAAKARFDGETIPVNIRVAGDYTVVYLDLCNDDYEVVEVTADGWNVISEYDVKFRRSSGMLELPRPEKGGKVSLLKKFVNMSDDDFCLFVAGLLATLCAYGPYPIVIICGEQGTAKSTTLRIAKSLVDANSSPLRAAPKEARDLAITAHNNWLFTLDNLSKLPSWIADCLCCLSTGGGFSTRSLYKDRDETIFEAKRPTMLNGIELPSDRGDLLDRALLIELSPIPASERRPESEIWQEFEKQKPLILGALLDGVSSALKNLAATVCDDMPRLADFVRWVNAAEEGLGWAPGTFNQAYDANRQSANAEVLNDPLAAAILEFMVERRSWEGTASELLDCLNDLPDQSAAANELPRNATKLSGALTRISPGLRKAGIDCERLPRSGNQRRLALRRLVDNEVPSVAV